MDLRHAAALALVGWYLVAPPPRTEDGTDWDPKAPLSEWQKIGKFDTVEDCRSYPDRLPVIMHGFYTDNHLSESDERKDDDFWKSFLAKSQCIATDDPRLNGK